MKDETKEAIWDAMLVAVILAWLGWSFLTHSDK